MSDSELERTHDYIQWLFPLLAPSNAVPGSPVLTLQELELARGSAQIAANLTQALDRMETFYDETDGWLAPNDHNHLRITRIIRSANLIVGRDFAEDFFNAIMQRVAKSGRKVLPRNIAYWRDALGT